MLRITPYVYHHEEQLPAEPGDTPAFWRVERQVENPFALAALSPGQSPNPALTFAWVADFPTEREATRYVAFLGDDAPEATVSAAQAAEALDSLDDCARMGLSVDAHGPRGVLERYIAQNVARTD